MVRRQSCLEVAAQCCCQPPSMPEFAKTNKIGLHLNLQKSKSLEQSSSTIRLVNSSSSLHDDQPSSIYNPAGPHPGIRSDEPWTTTGTGKWNKDEDSNNNNDQAQPVASNCHDDQAVHASIHDASEDGSASSEGIKGKEILTQGAWLVLIMFCAQEILTAGIASSFGIMYMEPLREYRVTAALKSWIYNVGRGLAAMAGFLAGPLSSAFGHRIALIGLIMGPIGLTISSCATTPYIYFLSHTILVSMGFGFSHYVLYLHMQKTFNKRRGLATGLFAATRAGSAAVISQLTTLLTASIGYRHMLRVMAASTLLPLTFATIQTYKDRFKPCVNSSLANAAEECSIATVDILGSQPEKKRPLENIQPASLRAPSQPPLRCFIQNCHQLKSKLARTMDFTVLKEPSFIVFTGVDCLLSLTTTNVFLALPFYSVERQFGNWVAATFLSTISIAEVVGAFLIPPLFDVKWINYLYIFCGLQFLAAGLFVAIGLHVSLTWMFIICGAFGLVRAGTMGMSNVFLIRHLSIYRFPSALSAKVLFKFGIFCIGPITGHLVDLTGSYSTCFFIFAGMMLASGLLTLLLPCARNLAERNGHQVNV